MLIIQEYVCGPNKNKSFLNSEKKVENALKDVRYLQ